MSGVGWVLVRILVGVSLLAGAALAAEAALADEIRAPELDAAGVEEDEDIEDLVADAQRLLRASGYDPGPIDGQFGPRTQRAIRAYQAAARRYGTLEAIKGPPLDDPVPELKPAGLDVTR